MSNVLPWDNEMFGITVIENPANVENAAPKVYAVTNLESGIQEMLTMQLSQAFVFAVQSKDTVNKAIEMSKPTNVIPFKRRDDGKTPPTPPASSVKGH